MQGTTVNSLPSHPHERSKVGRSWPEALEEDEGGGTRGDRGQLNFVANMSLQKVPSMVTKQIWSSDIVFTLDWKY